MRVLFILLLLLLLLPSSAQAQSTAFISVVPAAIPAQVGTVFPVRLELRGGSNVAGYEIELRFNPLLVQVVDADSAVPGVQVRNGSYLNMGQAAVTVNYVDNLTGQIFYTANHFSGAPAILGDGELLAFDLLPVAPGTSTLGFARMNLVSPVGDYLPLNVQSAQVYAAGAPLPTSTRTATASPTATTTRSAIPASATSTLAGAPTSTPTQAGASTPVPPPGQISTSFALTASPTATGPGIEQPAIALPLVQGADPYPSPAPGSPEQPAPAVRTEAPADSPIITEAPLTPAMQAELQSQPQSAQQVGVWLALGLGVILLFAAVAFLLYKRRHPW